MQLENKWIIPIRYSVLFALVGAMLGFGVYGCKKEEPVREESLPEKSVSLEGNLENTQIAFMSKRDGNNEIYVMNADGSEQKRLTDNLDMDMFPSWSPFLPLENETMEDTK